MLVLLDISQFQLKTELPQIMLLAFIWGKKWPLNNQLRTFTKVKHKSLIHTIWFSDLVLCFLVLEHDFEPPQLPYRHQVVVRAVGKVVVVTVLEGTLKIPAMKTFPEKSSSVNFTNTLVQSTNVPNAQHLVQKMFHQENCTQLYSYTQLKVLPTLTMYILFANKIRVNILVQKLLIKWSPNMLKEIGQYWLVTRGKNIFKLFHFYMDPIL